MTLRKFNFVWLTLVLLLTACSSVPKEKSAQAWLKPAVKVNLPTPNLTPAIDEQQLLTVNFKNKQQSLLVLLNADDKHISVAGLSPLGIRLFRLIYNEQGIETEQNIVAPELPPANQVLLDIMLSHWPLDVWQQRLPKGWSLKDQNNIRQLRDPKDEVIVEIHYEVHAKKMRPISLQHFAFGYLIQIQHLDDAQ